VLYGIPVCFSGDLNLRTIPDMRETLRPAGRTLSDHSMGATAAIAAAALGAAVIEKHFCLSRKIRTADCEFSMEPAELPCHGHRAYTTAKRHSAACFTDRRRMRRENSRTGGRCLW
jgi:sialic acid synthase SpsE